MGPSGHFYSHVDPVWSLYNVGTCCILVRAPSTKETLPVSPGKRDSMHFYSCMSLMI